ncbi:hypothetical protein Ae406Ps2_6463c [Pseudonocardia sp. Ae406_Ps2]|nr:hypothetical protein Ae406Ps2_6463c [Pseudonocardia sp. Ae406_Ps2]
MGWPWSRCSVSPVAGSPAAPRVGSAAGRRPSTVSNGPVSRPGTRRRSSPASWNDSCPGEPR